VSILSKIFIVLLVVLCIASSVMALLIQQNVLAPREEVAQLKQNVEELKVTVDDLKTQDMLQINDVNKALHISEADKNKSDAEAKTLHKERDKLADDLDIANKKVDVANGERDRWVRLANQANDDLDKIRKDLAAVDAKYEKANRSYQEINTKYTEVSTQREFLLTQVKLLREQIAILQDRLNNAAANTNTPPTGGAGEFTRPAAAAMPGPTIKGLVKAVADNMTMATIDVGANDGVNENMEFTIFRQGKFIGTLVVTRVDAKTAVGRLERVQGRVQIDDKAWNQLVAN